MTSLLLFSMIGGVLLSGLTIPLFGMKRKRQEEGDESVNKTRSVGTTMMAFFMLAVTYAVALFIFYYVTNIDQNVSSLWLVLVIVSLFGFIISRGVEQKVKGLIAFIALGYALFLISAPVWNANMKYEAVEMEERVEIQPFDETKKPASVPPQFVRNKMKKAFGQVPNTSYYELGHLQIQKVKDEYVYIAPVEFSGAFKWWKGKTIPGYFTMSATDAADNPRFVRHEMSYTPSSYFNKRVERHMRMAAPELIYYGDPQLEIDDDGMPYYIRSYGAFISARDGFDVQGIVMVDATTGETTRYALADIPSFIDGAVAPEAVSLQNSYYGKYIHGFWNAVLGKQDVKIPSDEGVEASVNPVFDEEGHMYYFTDFTSPKEEVDSMLGYALTDARTGEATYYTGNLEESYMDSEGALQIVEKKFIEKEWKGEMPVLYNFFGEASWLVPVLDSNGFLQHYFIVSAANPEISVFAQSPNEALTLYKVALQRGGSTVDSSSDAPSVEAMITVQRLFKERVHDMTVVSILSTDGRYFMTSTDVNPLVIFIQEGDELKVSYGDSGDDILQVRAIENMTLR